MDLVGRDDETGTVFGHAFGVDKPQEFSLTRKDGATAIALVMIDVELKEFRGLGGVIFMDADSPDAPPGYGRSEEFGMADGNDLIIKPGEV
jgi:hypothetical protein